jgi:hypothetical protein
MACVIEDDGIDERVRVAGDPVELIGPVVVRERHVGGFDDECSHADTRPLSTIPIRATERIHLRNASFARSTRHTPVLCSPCCQGGQMNN